MKVYISIYITFLILFITYTSFAQPYKNPELSVEHRIEDLLSHMTPEEKFWQLFMIPGDISGDKEKFKKGIFGFQVNTVAGTADVSQQIMEYLSGENAFETAKKINEMQQWFIGHSRLGIPLIAFDEALHGLVRDGATVFPQSIGLAATFNVDLMQEVATAIATECRTRGIRQVLSPVLNLASDVRWGRTEETYGEDPYLATEMGVAFVSAFEKMGVITTPKHYVANVGDGGRDSYPVHWNERLMRELHFPPFEDCIRRGGSRSIMTAYNSYDGIPCTSNDWLLNEILKKEWDFAGFVISDAGGTGGSNVLHMTASGYEDAAIQALYGGLDVIFQTDYEHYTLFQPPFLDGRISQKVIDDAVSRVLKLKFDLGLFENPYVDPEQARYWNGHQTHREIAKRSALESIVLLKNANSILPLSKKSYHIAVIGPDAEAARLGGYSGPGTKRVSILEGIKNKVGSNTTISHIRGCELNKMEYLLVPPEALTHISEGTEYAGLKGEYFNNITFQGEPEFTRIDEKIDFRWTLFSPDPEKLGSNFYSVRWTGELTAPETGTFKIGIDGNDGYRMIIGGEVVLENMVKRSRSVTMIDFVFIKGRKYDIVLEFYEPVDNAWFSLVWDVGVKDEEKTISEALELAAKSDIAILVVGILEGEFQDRALLGLPGRQEELIRRVGETGTPVVVILVGGSPVTMSDWMDVAEGIIMAWYPGEEGGHAVADVLFGDYNPAGRLPVSWPVHEGQLPLVYNHKPTGRGDDYINLTGRPLFPFGYGLSYADFQYSGIRLDKDTIYAGESTTVSVTIRNTGRMSGDEVVQLYLRDELASVARPKIELKGFKRVNLMPGESRVLHFTIDSEMLSMYDRGMNKVVEPGDFRIMIGASSADIRQKTVLHVRH